MKKLLTSLGVLFASWFKGEPVALEVNEEKETIYLQREHAEKLVERAQAADVAEAEVIRLTGELKTASANLTASTERVQAIEKELAIEAGGDAIAAISKLKALPGSAGTGAASENTDTMSTDGGEKVLNSWEKKAEKKTQLEEKKAKNLH